MERQPNKLDSILSKTNEEIMTAQPRVILESGESEIGLDEKGKIEAGLAIDEFKNAVRKLAETAGTTSKDVSLLGKNLMEKIGAIGLNHVNSVQTYEYACIANWAYPITFYF